MGTVENKWEYGATHSTQKTPSESGEIYETSMISILYDMPRGGSAGVLCRTMTPAEFDRPCSAHRLIFEARRACPPASMSEYEVFNDIIRYLPIEIRNFRFRGVRREAARYGHGKATKEDQSNPSMQILAWQVTPKRPRDLHELRPRL